MLQQDIINKHAKTTVVAPLLKGHRERLHAVNIFKTKQNGLDQARRLELIQLRAVDGSRLLNKQGKLESEYTEAIHKAIHVVFGFSF